MLAPVGVAQVRIDPHPAAVGAGREHQPAA
jgi:hypothetical protein